jgi:hypothetical protein
VKRNTAQREADLLVIGRQSLAGHTQDEIAKHISTLRSYSLSRAQIGFDLAILRKRWREESDRAIAELKARELARIGIVEREAWAAWERSKLEGKTPGNPRFLETLLRCFSARRELLGLDSPHRAEIHRDNGGASLGLDGAMAKNYGLSDQEIEDTLLRMAEEIKAGRAAAPTMNNFPTR